MQILRTPDSAFTGLASWPHAPHYTQIDADGTPLRVHHVDEGPADGPVVLLVHGEPTWGYLYRHMIPVLTGHGYRVIVPDLVGFGRSDKPAARTDYSYNEMVAWMLQWFDALEPAARTGVTFFGQDWGGLIGLRIVTARPDSFSRIVVANTGLPTGDRPPTDAFLAWQKFSQETPVFDIGGLIKRSCPQITEEDVRAYNAPFFDESYKSGARIMPSLVPTTPDDATATANREAWKVLEAWTKPLLTAFSDRDPITAGGYRVFQRSVPGAAAQEHVTVTDAGHFLQEDKGPELAEIIHGFISTTAGQ